MSRWRVPFDPATVAMKPTRTGFGEALVELGRTDPRVVVLGGDITDSVQTSLFREAFPQRFFSLGIAEQNMAGVAAGLSLAGKVPFYCTYGVFAAGRAWDQIRTTIAYTPCNVKIGGAHGGISVGPDGATHQALEEFAIMRTLPHMVVLAPCDANQCHQATLAAAAHEGPVYLRFGREAAPNFTAPEEPFVIGRARLLREGAEVTLAGCGHMTWHCLEAAALLEDEGLDVEVLDLGSIKPLDTACLLASAKKTLCVVTAEEHQLHGGMGSAVAELLARCLPVPMEMVGVDDRFGESGRPGELMEAFGLSAGHIAAACRRARARRTR